jgi:hypothetical protein
VSLAATETRRRPARSAVARPNDADPVTSPEAGANAEAEAAEAEAEARAAEAGAGLPIRLSGSPGAGETATAAPPTGVGETAGGQLNCGCTGRPPLS